MGEPIASFSLFLTEERLFVKTKTAGNGLAINKGGFFEIAFSSSSTHICLALGRLLTFCLTLTR